MTEQRHHNRNPKKVMAQEQKKTSKNTNSRRRGSARGRNANGSNSRTPSRKINATRQATAPQQDAVLIAPPKYRKGSMRITPLGGLGEIGRNMNVIEYNGHLLLIDCGVDREKVDEARGAILGELAAIRRGEVTEDELNFARLSLQNSFRSVGETASSLESFYLTQTLLGVEETPFDQCEKLARVTKEEVAAAAELLELSVSYLLTEDGGEEGADA